MLSLLLFTLAGVAVAPLVDLARRVAG